MQKLINVYKPIGSTPLEMIKKVKEQQLELVSAKMSYAGRLDPLAHGVLLLMVGDEIKKREHYLSIEKTYQFEVIFGIQTDTYDLLGLLSKTKIETSPKNVKLFVNTFVNKHIGKQLQEYPPYSSKPVNGKPLFWWARNDKLHEIEIPQHQIEIFSLQCLSVEEIRLESLKHHVEQSVGSVQGDFRQKKILQRWEKLFSNSTNQAKTLPTAKFRITCSSGTYIRKLVHDLGEEIGCGGVASDILRTAVGKYTLKAALSL